MTLLSTHNVLEGALKAVKGMLSLSIFFCQYPLLQSIFENQETSWILWKRAILFENNNHQRHVIVKFFIIDYHSSFFSFSSA